MALIYGEIDVEVPNISLEELKKFIDDTAIEHITLGHSKEEDTYLRRNNRKYPWERRILEYAGRVFYNYKNTKLFDQIYKVIEKLPINRDEHRVVLMLYQETQPNYDFNFHFDNDNPMGFRICLGLDTDKPFLEQAKIKPEFHQHALQLKKIEDYMVEEYQYTIKPIRSNTVFCLNADSYPHRVPIGSNTSRVAIVVKGIVGSIDHLNFLQRVDE